jgi:AcrR family transcriptional regulator
LIKILVQFRNTCYLCPVSERKMKKKAKQVVDSSTEEKIKEAARKVFTRKGYAAARTRDIAEEAGINLALLNYYFRSKEKLFDIIMLENLQHFIKGVKEILIDERTSLREKTELIASNYIDMLLEHPDLPSFILSELRANPDKLVVNMGIKDFLLQSYFAKQLGEALKANKKNINPLHFFMNIIGLVVFPFVGSPVFRNLGGLGQEQFSAMMQERKKLIPKWIEAMLTTP